MSTAKKFAGQTAIYGLSTILSRMIKLFFYPDLYICIKALPVPKVYGIFTAMYGYASIINPVLAFGMETTFFRYLNKREDNKQLVYNNAFGAVIATSVVFLLFALPLHRPN